MTVNTELADAARWIASVPGLDDPEKAQRWARLMESLEDVRPNADGAKQLAIIHWRADVEREIAKRTPSAPLLP